MNSDRNKPLLPTPLYMHGRNTTNSMYGSQETYKEYMLVFMRLYHHIQDLSEEFLIDCFISGTRGYVTFELMAKQLKNIIEAMRLTQLEEDKNMSIKKSVKFPFNRAQGSTSSTTTS